MKTRLVLHSAFALAATALLLGLVGCAMIEQPGEGQLSPPTAAEPLSPVSPIQTPTPLRLMVTIPLLPSTPTSQPLGLTPIAGRGTPTPNRSQFGTPPAIPAPSVTPLPISRITDLAPDLPDKDKVYVYVQHPNGVIELFLIRPSVEISGAIPLQANDVIINWVSPASLMGHYPPGATPAMPLATSTISLYPVPTTAIGTPFVSPLSTPTRVPLTP
jgi:hypothetical protein